MTTRGLGPGARDQGTWKDLHGRTLLAFQQFGASSLLPDKPALAPSPQSPVFLCLGIKSAPGANTQVEQGGASAHGGPLPGRELLDNRAEL